jgi:hypothetical protein
VSDFLSGRTTHRPSTDAAAAPQQPARAPAPSPTSSLDLSSEPEPTGASALTVRPPATPSPVVRPDERVKGAGRTVLSVNSPP